jgi:hypothetical protein
MTGGSVPDFELELDPHPANIQTTSKAVLVAALRRILIPEFSWKR